VLGRTELAIELSPQPTDFLATVLAIHSRYSSVLIPILTGETSGSRVLGLKSGAGQDSSHSLLSGYT
jgi:hypothetical protein